MQITPTPKKGEKKGKQEDKVNIRLFPAKENKEKRKLQKKKIFKNK